MTDTTATSPDEQQPSVAPTAALDLLDENGVTVLHAPESLVEGVRYMVARMRASAEGDVPQRVGITSALRGEGVTNVARTLALVLAHDLDRRVCLVDLNWWHPSDWPGDAVAGITDVMNRTASLPGTLIATGHPKLWVLPAGRTTVADRPNFANHPELEKVYVELSERFDHVVIDLPAVSVSGEAITLAESCGVVALVVCQGVTPQAKVRETMDELNRVQVVGAVLNRSSTSVPRFIRRHIPGS